MKQFLILASLAVAFLLLFGCSQQNPNSSAPQQNQGTPIIVNNSSLNGTASGADDKNCISERGKAYYPGKEKCCGDLKSIFGGLDSAGGCLCNLETNNCGGAPVCAPCGNGICEPGYSENQCSCPQDCK